MQATDQDDSTRRHDITRAGARRREEAVVLQERAQLLDKGRTNTALARTDNMWATLKVYASGGENGLHTHPTRTTLHRAAGQRTLLDADGDHTDVGKHEGSCCRRRVLLVRGHSKERCAGADRLPVGLTTLPAGSTSAARLCPAIRRRTNSARGGPRRRILRVA